jgi:hypothetical protein
MLNLSVRSNFSGLQKYAKLKPTTKYRFGFNEMITFWF